MSSKVYVKLPRAGLGNKLLTWSRGYVFSKINNLELYSSFWAGIRAGAFLRRENKKRLYFRYFREDSLVKKAALLVHILFKERVYEPRIARLPRGHFNTIYIFNKIYTDYDFFKEVRPHKQLVREGLFEMLTDNLQERFHQYEKPVIALHIRRGDFKIGCKLTPLSFFIEVINSIRKEVKQDLPVTVFTDANYEEIEPLFKLNAVKIAEYKPDILDLLLLASSRILVLSMSSSFSYWGAFLSEGIIIKHPDEWHAPFRLESDPLFNKEVKWDIDQRIPYE